MGFELRDGIFKKFVDSARKNYEDSQKTEETREKEMSVEEAMNSFFNECIDSETKTELNTVRGSVFLITNVDDKYVYLKVPTEDSPTPTNKYGIKLNEIRRLLESNKEFKCLDEIRIELDEKGPSRKYSYLLPILEKIKENIDKKKGSSPKTNVGKEIRKKYDFIIDEINRGEISKIFGELFFAIDPGYRGKEGEISTQYANLQDNPNGKFYIPENVYIIGTMNDIDRSVDSFDFAMRRRFRLINIKADACAEMLDKLDNNVSKEAKKRMEALNEKIAKTDELNENYQIGASYFLKLDHLNFDQLWTDCLKPLLLDYVRGMYDENEIMEGFEAKKGYYLYPENGGSNGVPLRMNRGSTYEDNVTPRDDVLIKKHGLKIPKIKDETQKISDYESFVKEMKKSENIFQNDLKESPEQTL